MLATNKIVQDVDKVKNEFVELFQNDCDAEIASFDIFDEISQLHIVREGYKGNTFEGKQCCQILNSIEKINFPFIFKAFKAVLVAHRNLVSLCYKEILPRNYAEIVNELKMAYNVLVVKFKVSISNKFHIIFDHLIDYFDHTRLSLDTTSDKLIEKIPITVN